ncbi:hypothetical protein GLYMA_06G003050v4 [Glycine max]|nr:hypothetical protein GLYMA_06G003050v4 [Glycine max]KAH1123524.1 hypothetical protein GYH30_013652 [Glycine max]
METATLRGRWRRRWTSDGWCWRVTDKRWPCDVEARGCGSGRM